MSMAVNFAYKHQPFMYNSAISMHSFGPSTMTYFGYKQLGWHGAHKSDKITCSQPLGCWWWHLNPRIMWVGRASCGLQCIAPPQQHAASYVMNFKRQSAGQ